MRAEPAKGKGAGWEMQGFIFGLIWFDRGGDGGPTDYAAPLGLRLLFGVWFYKYFAPLALGRGRTLERLHQCCSDAPRPSGEGSF
jgi:hypothetical protein